MNEQKVQFLYDLVKIRRSRQELEYMLTEESEEFLEGFFIKFAGEKKITTLPKMWRKQIRDMLVKNCREDMKKIDAALKIYEGKDKQVPCLQYANEEWK